MIHFSLSDYITSTFLEFNMKSLVAFRALSAFILSSLVAAFTLVVPAAHGQTFSNAAPLSIPEAGTAAPYPSVINVTGLSTNISGLRVRLKNFSHSFPADVIALLVAPNGQGYQLLNQNGEDIDVNGITLTLSSDSSASMQVPLGSGTFIASGGNTNFAAPATAIARAASLGALRLGNLNGQWKLFVQDTVSPDGGTIAGGWELEFVDLGEPTTPLLSTGFTHQGRILGGDANGTIDARFSLWSHPSTTSLFNRVAAPVTVTGIALNEGTFTTTVNLGTTVPSDTQTWLQIDVANPSGTGFVALSPRQPMTPAPIAQNVASGGFTEGALIGPGRVIGAAYHDPSNRGIKSRVGYAIDQAGLIEFAGMQTIVTPGTNSCGNASQLAFFTWECNTSGSREIMRIDGRGNVGIGTTTPTARLDVRGSIAMGATGELRAASSPEDLRIVRGSINRFGGISAGTGFTVSRFSQGAFQVTFTTPFSGRPTVTVTTSNSPYYGTVNNINTSGFISRTLNNITVAEDSDFEFIAVGPR